MEQLKPYEQFALVDEATTDGWRFGTITSFIGQVWGDAFVEAPDGSRAGIVWVSNAAPFTTLVTPDENRWGVYQVPFTVPMVETKDLVLNFRAVLPQLKDAYESAVRSRG